MDFCASVLLAFPPDGNDIRHDEPYNKAILSHLKSLDQLLLEHLPVITANAAELLKLLNPRLNSASYIVLIDAVLRSTDPSAQASKDAVLGSIIRILTSFDPRQIRYVGNRFLAVIDASYKLLPPAVVVEAMAAAILRLDPSGSMLTTTHCFLVSLAYNADCIPQILPVIDKPILYFPGQTSPAKYLSDMSLPPTGYITPTTGLTARLKSANVLEYDLLSGLCYCSIRDWKRAQDAFSRCISYPLKEGTVSKIMAEAYKKWVLVSLLLQGKVPEPPLYTNRVAIKAYSALAKPYLDLAALFITTEAEQLKAEKEKHEAIWRDDQSTGLINEVLASYQKWQIINLRNIYNKLKISQIRQQTKSAETGSELVTDQEVEILVGELIATKMLSGVYESAVDGHPASLTFLDPESLQSEADVAREIASTMKKVKELGGVFQAASDRLATHKEYIKSLQREKKRRENQGDGREDPRLVFDAQVEDEDLMTGIVPAAVG